jgi:long-chain acyl-CoA synthetase
VSLPRGIAAIAAVEPDRTALVHEDGRTTFSELDTAANRWACVFADAGVGQGDRVAVMLTNRPETFAVWNGAARLGALIVPVSYRSTAPEAAYLVTDSEAAAFVHEDAALARTVGAAAPKVQAALHVDDERVANAPTTPPTEEFLGARVIQMNYTSGTTGRPKGISRPVPAPTREAAPEPFAEFWGFGRDDVHLLCGPAYHTAPGNYAQMHLVEGGSVVIMRRFDAESCLALIETQRVSTSHMVPANFVRLLEADWSAYDRSSIRRILHAAAPCPVSLKEQILRVFPPDTVWEYYGASEGMATVISPSEWRKKPGSVGKPFPGIEITVLDDDGQELPAGDVGEVYVSSLPGYEFSYLHHPDKEAPAGGPGRFSVGDLGWLDEDGYLFLADRRVDLVISGGVNIYPAEIEQCLMEHPDIVDLAVFGLPDDRMGQRVHAVVELRHGAVEDSDGLLGFCADRLARFKHPRSIELVAELPREPNGKVLKRQLREARMQAGAPTDSRPESR